MDRSPGSNAGTVSNEAVKVSGWPSSTDDVRMSGVSTGSTPRSRSASSTARRNQVVRDIVQDLLLEALLDDLGRHLARAEAGNARLARSSRARDASISASTMSLGISTRTFFRVSLTSTNSVFIVRGSCVESGVGRNDACAAADAAACSTGRSSSAGERRLVRKGGVEPPKPFGYRILSPARLPVPPLSPVVGWKLFWPA